MPQQSSNPEFSEGAPTSPVLPTPVPGSREETPDEEVGQFDAANESLARALAVSFSVLRWIMLLLIVVFVASGFFTVAPDEVAVRTRFGQIVPGPDGEALHPEDGPYFRWPAPIGQVYRVPTITRVLRIDESFVFRVAQHNRDRPLSEQLSQGPRLDPQYDGALLTADQSIVHARYEVSYKVLPDNAARFVRNVASIDNLDAAVTNRGAVFRRAEELVRNAVEQAIVEDVAGTPLDRFLQGGRSQAPTPAPEPETGADAATDAGAAPPAVDPVREAQPPGEAPATQPTEQPGGLADPGSSIVTGGGQEDRVRVRAQAVLDDLDTGITLITVTRTEQMVASNVVALNNSVAFELSRARVQRDQAETLRNTQLIAAAGPAWDAVLAIIDAYEEAYRLREAEPARFERADQAMLATFNGELLGPILEGLAADLAAESPLRGRLESGVRRHGNERLRGSAGATVNSAASEASSYVAALEAEAARFEGMLAIYRDNPELVRHRMLTDTLRKVLSNPDAEMSFLAPGANLRLLIGRDRQTELEEESRAREARVRTGTQPPVQAQPTANQPMPQAPPANAGGDGHDH